MTAVRRPGTPIAPSEGAPQATVRVKAAVVDPATMALLWSNEEAQAGTIDAVVPMAESMGVPDAMREVARTGVPANLQANVISTGRGAMAVVVTIHRLPDGLLLVLAEDAWQMKKRRP